MCDERLFFILSTDKFDRTRQNYIQKSNLTVFYSSARESHAIFRPFTGGRFVRFPSRISLFVVEMEQNFAKKINTPTLISKLKKNRPVVTSFEFRGKTVTKNTEFGIYSRPLNFLIFYFCVNLSLCYYLFLRIFESN